MAFGLGFGMAQRTNLIAVTVPKEEIGEASAVLALVRNISGAFGVAIFSTILTNATNANALRLTQQSVLRVLDPQHVQQFIGLIILKAQVDGYATVFGVAAAVILFGAFASFLINVPKEAVTDKHQMILD
jgi:hypothetical protein